MQQIKLGVDGTTVSRLCLGTMTFGKQVDENTAASMLDACLDYGVNFVDTANVYNAGVSEEVVGKILRSRRDRVVLATKVGIRVGDEPHQFGLSRRTIQTQVEQSLRRLQTDYIDLYYLHQPDPDTPLEESLDAMNDLVRKGLVRMVGASNYAAWQLCRMHSIANSREFQPVVAVQSMYNLLARSLEPELVPACNELGVSLIAYNPLAGGLLTGKHKPELAPETGTRFDGNAAYQDRYWNRQNFDAVTRLSSAAQAEGRSIVNLSLSWLLRHSPTGCVIIGASSMSQLNENLEAAEAGSCSSETLAVCEDIWNSLPGIAPCYHR